MYDLSHHEASRTKRETRAAVRREEKQFGQSKRFLRVRLKERANIWPRRRFKISVNGKKGEGAWAFSWKTQIPASCDERRGILLPSKLVCHRVRLSQPALMIKIMSVLRWLKDKRSKKYKRASALGEKVEKRRHPPLPGHLIGNIPFAVRYIKLVVECFESYHSHFDELARRIDRREDFTFHCR